MLEAKQSGNVVEDFTIGNTRIKICDDFCRTRTSGEVKEILNRVARRTVGSLTAAATPDYLRPVTALCPNNKKGGPAQRRAS